MTREDIIRMAREAGLPTAWISESGVLRWSELTRFAALVAAAEREECAKVCDAIAAHLTGNYCDSEAFGAEDSAAAIRARGE